mgnify:CR=1 FL=1
MPNKINPVWYAVAIPLIGILIAVILVLVRKGSADSLDRFSVEQYREAATNFQGNSYTIEGQIDAQLAWDPEIGRLLSVRLNDGRLGVLAPKNLQENLSVGQRYRMSVQVDKDGLITLKSLQKL